MAELNDWLYQELSLCFEVLYHGFLKGAERSGRSAVSLQLADQRCRLHFAGSELAPQLLPALSHLIQPDPVLNSEFEIYLIDSTSLGSDMPLLVECLRQDLSQRWYTQLDPRGGVKKGMTERYQLAFHVGPNLLSMIDHQHHRAIYWAESAATLPYYERGSPLRSLLAWWLEPQGYQLVHAAAVGSGAGGILLVGKGGMGKSSTALACLQTHLGYVGDDYCMVRCQPDPWVYCLYNSAKLKGASDLERLPFVAAAVTNLQALEQEKALLYVAQHFPQHLLAACPLKAIFLPQVSYQAQTSLTPATAAQALAALAPTTLLQRPGSGQMALEAMAQLTRSLPCYHLHLGTDPDEIGQFIAAWLDLA